jgi:hypothetical protein
MARQRLRTYRKMTIKVQGVFIIPLTSQYELRVKGDTIILYVFHNDYQELFNVSDNFFIKMLVKDLTRHK